MRSSREQGSERRPPVPLATLIGREIRRSGGEPRVRCGHAGLAKRGEDYFLIKRGCRRAVAGSSSSTFSVFAVLDGHNGAAAAVFARDNLLDNVLGAIPSGLSREAWQRALPQALVAGFVKTDIQFQTKGESSGTTVTLAVVDGKTVTVASVGDSRCILDSHGGAVSELTVDHRLEENAEERERLTTLGAEVGRMNICGQREVGPLRCWPGGLCLSRSIGDADVGEFIVPIPHVKQVRLPASGGRLIIASDGVWDALSSETAAKSCRGISVELAAKLVVKEALRSTGLKDDTTCLVVDISFPADGGAAATPAADSQSGWGSLAFWRRRRSSKSKISHGGAVEQLFEEGSPWLSERLTASSSRPGSCAVCQAGLTAGAGAGQLSSAVLGGGSPRLCAVCHTKKDAMEGKLQRKADGGGASADAAGEDDGDDEDYDGAAFAGVRDELWELYRNEAE